MTLRTILAALALLAIAVGAVTGQSADALSPDKIIGRYQATEFTLVRPEGDVDLLCLDASLNLDLTADFVAGGVLVLPDTLGLPPSQPVLFGPYELDASTVRFEPEAGAFFEGADWTWSPGGILTAEVPIDGRTLRLELQRQ